MTTEEMADTPPQHTESANEPRGGIDRAIADAEKRIHRLVEKMHRAARGSTAFEGAKRDANRLLDWFEVQTRDLRTELNKLGDDVATAVTQSEVVKGLRSDAEHLKEKLSGGQRPEPPADPTRAWG